jgi:hypothetical protein
MNSKYLTKLKNIEKYRWMEKMKPREIFLNGCNEIAKNFLEYGFKPYEKGRRIKKVADDKDMIYEIYFQTSVEQNCNTYVEIYPDLWISSKELQKWEIEQTKNKYSKGIICAEKIRVPENVKSWKHWNLAGSDFDKKVEEIVNDIKTYLIPIVEIYKDRISAIEYLKNNGSKYFPWLNRSILPMAFMIYFGGKETAEIFLKDFLKNCNYADKIQNLYQELSKIKDRNDINLNVNEFHNAGKIKLAYVNGIKI